jgi:hypothetical protein
VILAQAIRQTLAEVLREDGIDAVGEVGPVFLNGGHGKKNHRALPG